MQSIAGLTEQVKTILIQTGGQQPRHEVYNHFINECNALNLTEDDFYKKVLAPASKSINWKQVEEDQKRKAVAEKAAQEATAKQEAQQVSLKYIHQEIKNSFESGVVPAVELNEIFRRAEVASQNIPQLAGYINAQIDKYQFKPYPSANTTTPDVKTKILSTNWYDSWHYSKLNTPAISITPPSPSLLPTPSPSLPTQPQPSPPPQPPPVQPQLRQGKSPLLKALLTSLLVIGLVGGSLFYLLWLKPYLKEKNAPRMYSFANTVSLRWSPNATGQTNVLQQLAYGTELPVYEQTGEWSKVKVNNKEGYVYTKYLLDKRSFYELNSILADGISEDVIPRTWHKKALLDYFHTHSIMGKMTPALQVELFGKVQQKEVWQLFAKEKNVKPNTVYYKKIVSQQSKFEDFAFVITNLQTQKRKFVLYSFSDTEDPVFMYEEDAPDSGNIMSVNKDYSDNSYKVRYTN